MSGIPSGNKTGVIFRCPGCPSPSSTRSKEYPFALNQVTACSFVPLSSHNWNPKISSDSPNQTIKSISSSMNQTRRGSLGICRVGTISFNIPFWIIVDFEVTAISSSACCRVTHSWTARHGSLAFSDGLYFQSPERASHSCRVTGVHGSRERSLPKKQYLLTPSTPSKLHGNGHSGRRGRFSTRGDWRSTFLEFEPFPKPAPAFSSSFVSGFKPASRLCRTSGAKDRRNLTCPVTISAAQ